MKRLIAVILSVLVLLCAAAPALAGSYVLLDDLPYGDAAWNLHLSGKPLEVTFDGNVYLLDGNFAHFDTAVVLMGGNTHRIIEHTLHSVSYDAADHDGELKLGTVTIESQPNLQLRIAQGNRETGEYVVSDPFSVEGDYTEDIYMPRDAAGNPLIIDRIYFYTFTIFDVPQYYAMSLYIDYENFPAVHAPLTDVSTPEGAPVEEKAESTLIDFTAMRAKRAFTAASKPFGDGLRAFCIEYNSLPLLERSLHLSERHPAIPDTGSVYFFFDDSESVAVFMRSDLTVAAVLDFRACTEAGVMMGLLDSATLAPIASGPIPLLTELQWMDAIRALTALPIGNSGTANTWFELPAETISAIR